MGSILYIIIAGVSLAMFVVKREQKLALLVFYSMCLSSVRTDIYIGHSLLSPTICFLLSEISQLKSYYTQLKHTPLFYLLMMMAVATFVVYFKSPHLQGAKGLYTILREDLISKYFVILYALFSLKSTKGLKVVVNTAVISIAVLTAFGILNLITRHAMFVDWAIEGAATLTDITEQGGERFTDDPTRFRVQSMHLNPFTYGYVCMFASVLFIYVWEKHIVEKSKLIMVLMCCAFGIITCASRTVMLCSLFSYAVYYALTRNMAKKVLHIMAIGIMLYVCYLCIPVVHDQFQLIGSMFDKEADSDVGGSSLEMRLLQLSTVLYYIQENILFGRGYGFFNIDLGWSDGLQGLVDKDLWGLEGVHLGLLLERGLVGLIVYVAFWTSMLYIFYQYRKTDVQTYALCVSITAGYLLFSFMTGELGSLFFVMLILGTGVKMHFIKEIQNKYNGSGVNNEGTRITPPISPNSTMPRFVYCAIYRGCLSRF